jgi:hypothetical protein
VGNEVGIKGVGAGVGTSVPTAITYQVRAHDLQVTTNQALDAMALEPACTNTPPPSRSRSLRLYRVYQTAGKYRNSLDGESQ